jgi:exosome complex exonuclease DIS3/RRP44
MCHRMFSFFFHVDSYLNFLSRLGLEGLVMFKGETKFDADSYTLTAPATYPGEKELSLSVFDKVKVEISVEKDRNTQRGKVKMILVDG